MIGRRYTKERLYELLPSIYRQRDIESGNKILESLLSVIAKQVEILEDDIEKLYDNWFIETCDEWVVPYIGDLLGIKGLLASNKLSLSQRSLVANTISYRRRKGTATVLEQLAYDITGWSAKVVEFFQLLGTTQNINHLRLDNLRTPDLRNIRVLESLNTPFDIIAHSVDVRSIRRGEKGYHNIPNIGLFLWRIMSFPVNNAPAYNLGEGRFSFSQLGNDMQLFNNNNVYFEKNKDDGITSETDVNSPISRVLMLYDPKKYYDSEGRKSIKIEVDNFVKDVTEIEIYDLSDWKKNRPKKKNNIAIDPELGRIIFPYNVEPKEVYVSYYYGFSDALGGGFYDRPRSISYNFDNIIPEIYIITKKERGTKHSSSTATDRNISIISYSSINDAISSWRDDGEPNAIFEIIDSEEYLEDLHLLMSNDVVLEIRAAQNQRPVLRGYIKINNNIGGNIILDGLLIDRKDSDIIKDGSRTNSTIINKEDEHNFMINVGAGSLKTLTIRHCTIVPKRISSLIMRDGSNNDLIITLDHTICGRINTEGSEAKLKIINSIVDGKKVMDINESGKVKYDDSINDNALNCYRSAIIENSTIFGSTKTTIMDLASNSIFTDTIKVERRQIGCIRFCYVPEGSEVPRCYYCQPSYKEDERAEASLTSSSSSSPESSRTTKIERSSSQKKYHFAKITPRFTSEEYGRPGYALLHKDVAKEIFEGADNGSEMGVFNSLLQPLRINVMRSLLEEYLRFGLESGVILVE